MDSCNLGFKSNEIMLMKKFKDLSSFYFTSIRGENLTVRVLNANTNSNLDTIGSATNISTNASNSCKKFGVKNR
jgi:hypothetical protein